MNQVIGLMLLIAAISVALYIGTNYDQLSGFGISNFPSLRPVDYVPSIDLPEYTGGASDQSAVIETAAAPITVSYVRPPANSSDPGELVLSASWDIPAAGVDIKGWQIGSLENDFQLPGAQDVYTFGGSANSLIIRPGDEVHIYGGTSPRGNFRINKCIGYLSELGNFTPPLEQRCPAPSYEETQYLTNACKNYISTIGACSTPKNISASVSYNDTACYQYLNTITYEGCVARHRGDSDFLDRAIWVWSGNDLLRFFDPNGDIIRIFDTSGKLVSQYMY